MLNLQHLRRLAIVTVLLNAFVNLLFAQKIKSKNGLIVTCSLPNVIKDNSNLNVRFVIKNRNDSAQIVYANLIEGSFNDILGGNSTNFKLVINRKRVNGYQPYYNKAFLDPGPEIDTLDNHRKVTLASKDSIVSHFHVDELYKFDPGYYRLKCLYWNNIHVNKSIETSWIYFRVLKTIYVKHYVNEPNEDSIRVIK